MINLPDFVCRLHNNVIDAEFMSEHKSLFPSAYFSALPMAGFAIEVAKKNLADNKVVMLPFDYMVEAEAMGAKVYGHNDYFGLRGGEKTLTTPEDLLALPGLDFTKGRLEVVLQAIKIVRAQGFVPCLNLSGLFAIADVFLPTEKLFLAWHKKQERQKLLQFWQNLAQSLVEFACLAVKAGAGIISLSDPLVSLEVVGKKIGEEIGSLLIFPLLESLKKELLKLNQGCVVHLCGVTSTTIKQVSQVSVVVCKLPKPMPYNLAVAEIAQSATTVKFLAYGCLNHSKISTEVYELILP